MLGLTSLPLSILREAVSHPVIVETTSGDRHEGKLASLDVHHNLTLENVLTRHKTLQLERQERLLVKQSTVKLVQLPSIVTQCPQLQLTATEAAQQWKDSIRKKVQLRKQSVAAAVAVDASKAKREKQSKARSGDDKKGKSGNGGMKKDGKPRRTFDPKKGHTGGPKKTA